MKLNPIASLLPLLLAAQAEPQVAGPVLSAKSAFVGLSVADLARSEKWYIDNLGLAVLTRMPRSDATRSAVTVLQGGGLTVELIRHDDGAPPTQANRVLTHGVFKVGVFVDNYETALSEVRRRGIPFAFGPFPAGNGQPANFAIRDNAGNMIQVLAK
jgi:catechol-2,3-dioxygenase